MVVVVPPRSDQALHVPRVVLGLGLGLGLLVQSLCQCIRARYTIWVNQKTKPERVSAFQVWFVSRAT